MVKRIPSLDGSTNAWPASVIYGVLFPVFSI